MSEETGIALDPVGTAVVGLGGYAGRMIDKILEAETRPDHPPRLVAVTSSDPARHEDLARRLEDHGVDICPGLDDLLGRDDVEAVWLPVPIDLHLPFVARSLAAGKAVMCEKPVAGSVDECDRMILDRDRSGLPVAVGYQSIYDPATLALKRRILAGDLGRITSATLHAAWPRDEAYYGRADWAGRLSRNGVWILDSPFQNAFGHFSNLALFLLGPTEAESTVPVRAEAELYRVYDIENYDTAAIRLTLDTGATFLVLLTHAARRRHDPVIRLTGERGTATWRFDGEITVERHAQSTEIIRILDVEAQRLSMVSAFDRLVRGSPDPDRMIASLEQARATLVAVNGVSEATPVQPIPPDEVDSVPTGAGSVIRAVAGIEEIIAECARRGLMLDESSSAAWTVPPGVKDLAGYDHFSGPHGWSAE